MVFYPGKCCYIIFGSNPDKSDLILEGSTKIPLTEGDVVLGVGWQVDFLTWITDWLFTTTSKAFVKKLQTN